MVGLGVGVFGSMAALYRNVGWVEGEWGWVLG